MSNPTEIVWESIPCEVCGTAEYEIIFKGPDRLENQPGEFTLVRCHRCGAYRQNPRPVWESLEKYYTEDYASHPNLVQDETSFLRRLDKRYGPWKRRRLLEKYVHVGKLLEIGCGTGLFLEEISRFPGWEVAGVEPSARAAAYVRDKLDIQVYHGRVEDIELEPEQFDVVVMWNVVEHLAYPLRDLRNIYRLIKKGGWLIFSVPNLESVEARVFGRYWVGWDLPRHLYIYPRETLQHTLNDIGFQVIDTNNVSTGYSLLGHSLTFWSQDWRNPVARRLLAAAYYNPVTRLAVAPMLWILDRTRRSTLLTYIAQKSV